MENFQLIKILIIVSIILWILFMKIVIAIMIKKDLNSLSQLSKDVKE